MAVGEGVTLHKVLGDQLCRIEAVRRFDGANCVGWDVVYWKAPRTKVPPSHAQMKKNVNTLKTEYQAQELVVKTEHEMRNGGWHNVGMCGLCHPSVPAAPPPPPPSDAAKKQIKEFNDHAAAFTEKYNAAKAKMAEPGFWEKGGQWEKEGGGKPVKDRLNEFKKNVEARAAKEAKDRITRLAELKAKLIAKSPSQQSSLFGLGDDDFDEDEANALAENIKASAKELEAAIKANTIEDGALTDADITPPSYAHILSFETKVSDAGKFFAKNSRSVEPEPKEPEPPVGGRTRKFKCEDY